MPTGQSEEWPGEGQGDGTEGAEGRGREAEDLPSGVNISCDMAKGVCGVRVTVGEDEKACGSTHDAPKSSRDGEGLVGRQIPSRGVKGGVGS